MGPPPARSSEAVDSPASARKFEQDSGIQVADVAQFTMRDFHINTTHNINNAQDRVFSPEEAKNAFIESLEFEGMNERHDSIDDNTPSTCQWLLGTDEWLEWQKSVDTQILTRIFGRRDRHPRRLIWIKGKPGAGKSTYMKFAVRHARRSKNFQGNVILAHFFNARGPNETAKSFEGMYRTFLAQLLRGLSPEIVQKLAQSRRTEIKGGWKLYTLWALFRDVIQDHITQPVTCFIDALDECAEEEVQHMVKSFCNLAQTRDTRGFQFRACFASRHDFRVSVADDAAIDLKLDQQPGHLKDIETYIERHLQVSGSRIAHIVHEKVRIKTQGVFIWCRLVIDILNKEYSEGGLTQEEFLHEKLNTIPEDLHELFSAMLERQEEVGSGHNIHATEATILCMQWALFSQDRDMGPLWWAIQRTCQPKTSTAALEARYQSHSRDTMKRYILGYSKGLLEVDESKHQQEWEFGSLQVIHESARSFLLNGGLAQLMRMRSSTEKEMNEFQVAAQSHKSLRDIAIAEGSRHSTRWPEHVTCLLDLDNTFKRSRPLLFYSRFSIHHANEACQDINIDQAPFLENLKIYLDQERYLIVVQERRLQLRFLAMDVSSSTSPVSLATWLLLFVVVLGWKIVVQVQSFSAFLHDVLEQISAQTNATLESQPLCVAV